ncbi:MAG: helix-hairpin-helix domain-containing protein [Lachnospiraceae bacterium]|nr:helix-hairpin-helix domain-containing protein [Lachnospiraceae bacterium]
MQRKNRIEHTKWLCLAGALVTVCFLCGCTRKEELLILTEEKTAQETISEAAQNGEAKNTDLGDAPTLMQEDTVISHRTEAPAEGKTQQESAESSILYVHVCGAVEAPGVYELPAGSRVYEAVQAAGGFSEDAEQSYVNQAQVLSDGVKLVIPTVEEASAAKGAVSVEHGKLESDAAAGDKKETALQIGIIGEGDAAGKESPGQTEAKSAKQADDRININTATKQELCSIPGVGETRAAAIISYRESHGGFAKPEDIMKVNGIKEGMYEKIKDSISVE